MRISRNRFLFRVQPVNSDLTHEQPQEVALLVEGNTCNGLLEVQEVLRHEVFVRHRPLTIRDVDLHLLDLPFQLVLLLRQVFRRREGFPPEVRGVSLANHGKVTLEFLAHVSVLALKPGQLRFQGRMDLLFSSFEDATAALIISGRRPISPKIWITKSSIARAGTLRREHVAALPSLLTLLQV